MSTGARFLKCDLHMHTPSDRTNWRGPRMGDTPEERQAAADAYIRRCYEEGLELIAITDHNFFSKDFIPTLQESAARLAPSPARQLTILPGFEIQADVGKGMHVICIFDADADVNQIDHILTECGIGAERTAPMGMALNSTKRLPEIIDVVQKRAAGRCMGIVTCPHCQAHSGIFDNDRIAEWLQATEFINPDLLCVEVPKPISQMRESWQHLFRADNDCIREWRRTRPIACIMSSDAKALVRDEAENYIGFRYSWIKVAQRSVEGLRQAFLAHESRVRLTRPAIPDRFVRSIEVGACSFFLQQPLRIDLNPQFNALIGGRGTGKSTILEYLRWCLCDQPLTYEKEDPLTMELPPYAERQASLIAGTLKNQQASQAYVRVELDLHGTNHVVTRYAVPERITLQIADAPAREATADDIRRLLPIQAYSQKQLSTVAVRVEELRRLVEAPVRPQVQELDDKIQRARDAMRQFYQAYWRAKQLDTQIRAHEAEIESLAEQAKSLRAQITNLSPADERVLSAHSGYANEQQIIQRVEADISAMRAAINEAQTRLDVLPRDSSVPVNSPQQDAVARIVLAGLRASAEASELLAEAAAILDAREAEVGKEKAAWGQALRAHEEAFAGATPRAEAYGAQLAQLRRVTERATEVQRALDTVRAERATIVTGPNDESQHLNAWISLHKDRADVIEEACTKLAELSQGDVRVLLRRGGDAEQAFSLLRERTAGARVRTEWLDRLREQVISASNPASEWTALLEEFRALAEIPNDQASAADLPNCPQLAAAGFTEAALRNVAIRFGPNDWLDLVLTSLNDSPEFYYAVGDGKEIPFEKASPGQQATALLTILLNQEGGPLLIDQPEDDLDNAIMTRVVETIWLAKEHRQLIFTSHNANLVVNGDAELVIHCDHIAAGNRSAGRIACAGSIDEPRVCDAIKSVMEGGERAFELRKAKYGL